VRFTSDHWSSGWTSSLHLCIAYKEQKITLRPQRLT